MIDDKNNIETTCTAVRSCAFPEFVLGFSISHSVRSRSVQASTCLVGVHCGHAILTEKIGVYRCPFGECFKHREASA